MPRLRRSGLLGPLAAAGEIDREALPPEVRDQMQAAIYVACSPKSNAAYLAITGAQAGYFSPPSPGLMWTYTPYASVPS